MRYCIKTTINNEYRAMWKDGTIFLGYKDFSTKSQAEIYIKNQIKNRKYNNENNKLYHN